MRRVEIPAQRRPHQLAAHLVQLIHRIANRPHAHIHIAARAHRRVRQRQKLARLVPPLQHLGKRRLVLRLLFLRQPPPLRHHFIEAEAHDLPLHRRLRRIMRLRLRLRPLHSCSPAGPSSPQRDLPPPKTAFGCCRRRTRRLVLLDFVSAILSIVSRTLARWQSSSFTSTPAILHLHVRKNHCPPRRRSSPAAAT